MDWTAVCHLASILTANLSFLMAYDAKQKNPAVESLINGTAPQQVRAAAARGILPLPQDDLLEVLVVDCRRTRCRTCKDRIRNDRRARRRMLSNRSSAQSRCRRPFSRILIKRAALPNVLYEAVVTSPSTPSESIVAFAQKDVDRCRSGIHRTKPAAVDPDTRD